MTFIIFPFLFPSPAFILDESNESPKDELCHFSFFPKQLAMSHRVK